jgi:two-component system response regulator FixJ
MRQEAGMAESGMTVLVADAHPAVRAALRFALELEGMSVRTVADIAEFATAENLAQIDCLVLDLARGGAGELDAVDRLRRAGCDTPVIFTATHPGRGVRARVERAGASLVEKPLIGEALVERIRGVARRSSLAEG